MTRAHYCISIHENTRMLQDFNPNPSACSFAVIFGHVKDKTERLPEIFRQGGFAVLWDGIAFVRGGG